MKKRKKVKINKTFYLGDFYQSMQMEAVYNALTKSEVFFERKVRRWFSKNYSTPLLETYKIPWPDLLIHYYEAAIEDRNHNELYELAVENYLPVFINKKEEEDKAFAERLVKEQQETLRKKRGITKGRTEKPQETKPRAKSGVSEMKHGEMQLNFKEDDFEEDEK